MALLAAWLLFPAALTLVSLGLGLLVERLSGARVHGVLLLPIGFAAAIVVALIFTNQSSTARLALPAEIVLAIAGLVLGRARLFPLRLEPWALAAAGVVAVVFGASTVFSGDPTFQGYTLLGDTGHQLSLAQLLAHHGRDYNAYLSSSFFGSVQRYIDAAYPIGSQATLGVLAPLGAIDLAWLYQPFLSFAAVMTTLALYGLAAPWVRARWIVAAAASGATMASLVLGFALQGSIKEMCALAGIALFAALVSGWLSARVGWRALLPLGVAAVASVASLGPAAVAFLGISVLPLAFVLGRDVLRRRDWTQLAGIGGIVVLTLLLAYPVLANVSTAYQVTSDVLSSSTAGSPNTLGHLPYATDNWHLFGIWLIGDWRYNPVDHLHVTFILIGVAVVGGLLGLLWALRRVAWGPLIFLASGVIGGLYLLGRGNTYADAKTLMLMSPPIVLLSILGAEGLRSSGRRLEAVGLVALVLGGVLYSGALAYHDVDPGPYHRFKELLTLNDRLASKQEPVLFNEWDEWAKYFLRDARPQNQPEISDGLKPGTIADTQRHPSVKTPVDPDEYTLDFMASKRWFITRRSPEISRPPAFYDRVWVGKYYELWENRGAPNGTPKVLEHLALGKDVLDPGATPRCADVRTLARKARAAGGKLAYVERPLAPTFVTEKAQHPASWNHYAGWPGSVVPSGPGRVKAQISFPDAGTFRVWMEGSFGRAVTVYVDGRRLGSVSNELGYPGQHFDMGSVRLSQGLHDVELVRGGGDLRPANGDIPEASVRNIGPVVFNNTVNEALKVQTIDPAQAEDLCGKRLDWIEVIEA